MIYTAIWEKTIIFLFQKAHKGVNKMENAQKDVKTMRVRNSGCICF